RGAGPARADGVVRLDAAVPSRTPSFSRHAWKALSRAGCAVLADERPHQRLLPDVLRRPHGDLDDLLRAIAARLGRDRRRTHAGHLCAGSRDSWLSTPPATARALSKHGRDLVLQCGFEVVLGDGVITLASRTTSNPHCRTRSRPCFERARAVAGGEVVLGDGVITLASDALDVRARARR